MVHRLQFHAMGCDMLACVDNGLDQPPAMLSEVPAWFEEWEQTFSRFRLDSELSRLNRANSRPEPVSEAFWQVFQSALVAEQVTGGLVTPTVADAVLETGYDRDFSLLAGQTMPPLELIAAAIHPLAAVIWDETTHSICLPEGVHLDLGGIAKGWSAHQAMRRLESCGAALMNSGGDVAMSGPLLDGSPWEIGVFNPFNRSEYVEMLFFEEACGVATSGRDRRRWVQGDQPRHHIIDPRSGLSAQTDVMTATVIAPTVMEAEAAAKAVLIQGSQAGSAWLEADPALAGLLILEDGQMIYSQRMEKYL